MRRRRWPALAAALILGAAVTAFVVHRYRAADPARRLAAGQHAAQAGDYDTAERLAELLSESGEDDRARLLWGETLFCRGRLAEALSAFNQVRAGGELRLRAVDLSGRCLVGLGERREAERVFHFLLSERPDDVEAHRFLASIYYDQGEPGRAAAHLREVARLDPADARPFRLLGLIHNDADNPDEAIEAYREALRRNLSEPAAGEARVEVAECLLKRLRPAEALEAVDGLESELGYLFRAQALADLNRPAEAATLLDEALRRYPGHPGLSSLRAERYLAEGRDAEAVALLEPALAANPGDYRGRFHLARAYERLGRREDAVRAHRLVKETQAGLHELSELSKQAMKDPWDAAVRRRLGDVCERIGRPDLAAMWRKAADACGATAGTRPGGAAPRPPGS